MNNDGSKPFLDHLEDLRKMLFKSIIALVVCMGLCLGFVKYILALLKHPLTVAAAAKNLPLDEMLVANTPMSPLNTIMQTALLGGLLLALPFMLFFVGQFILPALTAREKRLLIPAFSVGAALFLGGVAFCYFLILPQTLTYLMDLGNFTEQRALWALDEYLGFIVQLLIAFGVSFELPLVIVILAKLGIISKKFLAKYRRHAFLVIFIFTTCMMPTTDPWSLMAMAGPMYLLYEASIFCVGWIERKRAADDAANHWEDDYDGGAA
ncbi:MAG: twin-arginine translocase subunit TatC [Verrucomicrobiales bacterium]|nr:twin-arginine translocase subunit TatC [Verrucomicrobiales bacterium]